VSPWLREMSTAN